MSAEEPAVQPNEGSRDDQGAGIRERVGEAPSAPSAAEFIPTATNFYFFSNFFSNSLERFAI